MNRILDGTSVCGYNGRPAGRGKSCGKGENMITVNVEPDGKSVTMYKTRTVIAMLNKLDLRPTMALVIRNGELLTPDVKFNDGDEVTVKKVTSAG